MTSLCPFPLLSLIMPGQKVERRMDEGIESFQRKDLAVDGEKSIIALT